MKRYLIEEKRVLLEKFLMKYELKTLIDSLNVIEDEMKEFSLKVLFIGKFSAGKSALINAFLEREVLNEGLRPETAIAGELVYDSEEYIEAVKNGQYTKIALDEATNLNVEEFDYLLWHLNCEILNTLNSTRIVDMPGFDSGITNHNKAILQYAGKGNAYIFVIDSEEGAIKQSMMQFIEEIKNYDNNMAIVVSKSDLKLPDDMQKITSGIKNSAQMLFGEDVRVVSTSKYDDEVKQKILSLIQSFNEDTIFGQKFIPELYSIATKVKDSLEVYKQSIKLDVGFFDKEIQKHEESKKLLNEKLLKENKKLENKFKNAVVPSIITDAQNALYSHADSLANSLAAGGQVFSMEVNNILRPILLSSTQKYVEKNFDEYLSEVCLDMSRVDDKVEEISKNTLDKYRQVNEKLQEISDNSEKFNAIYKTITTTLSIATSAIAPWLELIIIFLPDIIKMISKTSKETTLKNKVNGEIIPQIMSKLRPEIESSVIEMKDELVQSVTGELTKMIDAEMEAIEKAKLLKEEQLSEYEEKIREVDSDLEKINSIIESFIV